MPAANYNFSIEQGSSFKLSVVYKDAAGQPINISNWCARLVWKTSSNISQVFSSDNIDHSLYKFTLDGVNGKLTIMFPSDTTNSFNFASAKYDLELRSPNELYYGGGNYTTRILYGTINIVKRFSQNSSNLEC
jgi:hypothetical protein